jgi:hypothetical protein
MKDFPAADIHRPSSTATHRAYGMIQDAQTSPVGFAAKLPFSITRRPSLLVHLIFETGNQWHFSARPYSLSRIRVMTIPASRGVVLRKQ